MTTRASRISLAIATGSLGFINLLSNIYPSSRLATHFQDVLTLELRYGGRLTIVFLALLLLILTQHIWRGKKVALNLVFAILVVTGFAHLLKGFDWEEALLNLVIAGLFFWQRKNFTVESDPVKLKSLPLNASLLLLSIIA